MRHLRSGFALAVLAISVGLVSVAGCATSGGGSGLLVSPGKPDGESVAFLWRASPDVTNGTIRAILADGREFSGNFMQVSSTTQTEQLTPYWSSWGSPWYGWGGPGMAYSDSGFVRHYSGRVIAQLQGPDGVHMRCFFTLARPEDGPQSGGQGNCEMSNGERIDYAELRGE